MANHFKMIVLAAAASVFASSAYAQSATASASGSGTLISPITLTKDTDLAFGTIVKPTTGNGTVTIGAGADTVAVTGTGTASMGTASRAKFTVGGEGGQTYAVTVPSTFVMSSGGNNITVNLTASQATGTLSGALGANGVEALNVGGSFTLPSTQASGNYSGSFNVTTAYN